ncbi:MAG: DUF1360 domain-containing protein [Actinomycetota bacterium]|nr:DUF1360 domain-containing protein [Actinomycetota bacterium]
MTTDSPSGLRRLAEQEKHAYTQGEERPLGSFLALLGAYGGFVAGLAAMGRSRGATLPERVAPGDLALVAVATFELSRLLAKDPVTSPLRAPFTTFAGTSGEAELAEEVRGSGARKALGELVTCPFCLGQWVATGLLGGLVLAPRPTRLAAAVLTAVAGASTLQLAYARLQSAAT